MKPGLWVFVCGPSGAGKDSVLAWTQRALASDARIVFARRLVTRPAGPGSDHEEVGAAAFERLRGAGRLTWHWQANGHHYGVAAGYAADVQAGRIVVVNGSREHAAALPARGPHRLALVTAAPELLAQRLRGRGRETAEAIGQRIARSATLQATAAHLVITNDGELAQAGAQLQAYLRGLAA
jgi:phosphonate metabolism protein PhnN/1,5-bisphosphokinase (PRPP-forming)